MRKVLTPPAAILKDTDSNPHNEPITDLTPIVNQITPVVLVSFTQAPQTITYNYNLIRFTDISKLSKVEKVITAYIQSQAIVTSPGNNSHFSVTIPRKQREIIPFKKCLLTRTFDKSTGLSFIVGKDQNNLTTVINLSTLPHLLIAGTTGSGKSVIIHNIIASLLFKNTPATLSLALIDCKRIELSIYNRLPHLISPVITDAKQAEKMLKMACDEMDKRYKIMEKGKTKQATFPALVIVIDELADLLLQSGKNIELYLVRLAQLGRAAKIHLILATQRPCAAVLPGLLSANIPGKICLKCAKTIDSVLILGHKGGELLTGSGDCIVKTPDTTVEKRIQAPYISEQDTSNIVRYWKHPEKAS